VATSLIISAIRKSQAMARTQNAQKMAFEIPNLVGISEFGIHRLCRKIISQKRPPDGAKISLVSQDVTFRIRYSRCYAATSKSA